MTVSAIWGLCQLLHLSLLYSRTGEITTGWVLRTYLTKHGTDLSKHSIDHLTCVSPYSDGGPQGLFFFWPCPWHAEAPGPEIQPSHSSHNTGPSTCCTNGELPQRYLGSPGTRVNSEPEKSDYCHCPNSQSPWQTAGSPFGEGWDKGAEDNFLTV